MRTIPDAIVTQRPAHPWLDALRRVGIGVLCMLLVAGCGAADPADSGEPVASATTPIESPHVDQSLEPTPSLRLVASGDPAAALAGRA